MTEEEVFEEQIKIEKMYDTQTAWAPGEIAFGKNNSRNKDEIDVESLWQVQPDIKNKFI